MEQTTCDRCQAPLEAAAAYCDRCGQRTRRARRIVRLAIRIEVLLIVMIVVLVFGFTAIYANQR